MVLYEGENDIAKDRDPQLIVNTFRHFIERVHEDLPACRIYVLSIKPSIKNWDRWPQTVVLNRLLAEECEKKETLVFVDVATAMLDHDGQPRPELYLEDRLHMSEAGYAIWRNILYPLLMDVELPFEQAL